MFTRLIASLCLNFDKVKILSDQTSFITSMLVSWRHHKPCFLWWLRFMALNEEVVGSASHAIMVLTMSLPNFGGVHRPSD